MEEPTRRWLGVVAVCWALAAATGCTIDSGSAAACRLLAPRAVELDGPVATVPLLMRGHCPYVEVTIDGRGPYLFLVDTGCRWSGIDASLAEALGLEASRTVQVQRTDGEIGKAFPVRRLQAGGAVFRDVLLDELLPLHGIDAEGDGILGLNAFSDCQVQFDFPKRELRLLREPMAAGADEKASFRIERPLRPVVRATFEDSGGVALSWPLLVDTGYNSYFQPPDSNEPRPFRVIAEAESVSHSRYGTRETRTMRIEGAVSIGRYEVTPVILSVPRTPSPRSPEEAGPGLLGMRILENFVLAVDLRAGVFSLLAP